jgi:hypothetical protein
VNLAVTLAQTDFLKTGPADHTLGQALMQRLFNGKSSLVERLLRPQVPVNAFADGFASATALHLPLRAPHKQQYLSSSMNGMSGTTVRRGKVVGLSGASCVQRARRGAAARSCAAATASTNRPVLHSSLTSDGTHACAVSRNSTELGLDEWAAVGAKRSHCIGALVFVASSQ